MKQNLLRRLPSFPTQWPLNTKEKMVKKANKDDVERLLLQGYHQFEGGALIKAQTDIKHIRERVVVDLVKRLQNRADNSVTHYFAKLQSKDSNWAISLFMNLAKKQGIDFAVCQGQWAARHILQECWNNYGRSSKSRAVSRTGFCSSCFCFSSCFRFCFSSCFCFCFSSCPYPCPVHAVYQTTPYDKAARSCSPPQK
ncbi:hypothetical protein BDB00DRAFT_337928 [Zychaea mexicana]|uniref:uncharacterized protein n=1 Tax=Zychaea mexicana TaxID=64656 RepID=UPI0022FE6D8B|nr:uncharacterized protein BDB00DRAFT_337928 [Zychaea mexicana]KAI9494206.1 hypothetical protein BDB00DRAFT_337928 [Zychaea mexicana]